MTKWHKVRWQLTQCCCWASLAVGLVWLTGCGSDAPPPVALDPVVEPAAGRATESGAAKPSSGPSPAAVQKQQPRGAKSLELPDSPLSGSAKQSPTGGVAGADRGTGADADSAFQPGAPMPGDREKSGRGGQAAATPGTIDPTAAGQDDYLPRRRVGPLALVPVDHESLEAQGLHRSRSHHLTLWTDDPQIDNYQSFHDFLRQAIEQWVEFFGADPRRFADWHLTCFLMVDQDKFRRAGVMPDAGYLPRGEMPPGGWQYGTQIWVNHQPGDYYTRHMLLHEAVHAFSAYNFGTLGSPWLAEGLAEYLALHRWQDDVLETAARVTDKEELAYWGRVKLVQDAVATGMPKSLMDVIRFPSNVFPEREPYAWSWVVVSLFDGHPQLQPVFRRHLRELGQISDNQWTRRLLDEQPLTPRQLESQWQVIITQLVYGHDFARTAIRWADAQLLSDDELTVIFPADGAWHSSGWRLPAGRWQATAEGQYQVAVDEFGAWISQPDGITIRYVAGQPLGQVQYALVGEKPVLVGYSELTQPQPLGSAAVLTTSGEELFLRINDWPNRLEDNRGQVQVTLRRL